jgi:BolA family transcriptional regulator, general stress-responsive regulator
MSEVTALQIELRLREALNPTHLEVIDESAAHMGHAGSDGSGKGTHFRVVIATSAAAQASRVARHRLVYDALAHELDNGIHALAIEWKV